jgi:hypothetical protein
MPWARIDDDAPSHPKMFRAGVEAFGFWVAGNCFCNKRLTDGFIPDDALALIYPGTLPRKAVALAERLVQVGLWERVEGGWRVHDFHQYNPTADEVRKERQAAKERKDRWKEKRRGNASGTATERRSTLDGNGDGTAFGTAMERVPERVRNDAHARAATRPDPTHTPLPPVERSVPEAGRPRVGGLCAQPDRQAGRQAGECAMSFNCPRYKRCRAEARTG